VKTCPDCNGEGVIEKGTDDEQRCPRCGGSGFVPDDDDDEEVTRTCQLVTQSGNEWPMFALDPISRTSKHHNRPPGRADQRYHRSCTATAVELPTCAVCFAQSLDENRRP
jgi:RecJ-like exonuclease